MGDSTRGKLLQAAEQILLEQGVHGLTVRRIGELSGMNPALITYHFGGITAMLEALSNHNRRPLLNDWAVFDEVLAGHKDMTAAEILETWLAPMLSPPAFNEEGRALIVIDEIASHGDIALSRSLVNDMAGVADKVAKILAERIPHLEPKVIRLRLRLIAGAALGPPPRVRNGEFEPTKVALQDLLRFALDALKVGA
jgi:AcrR family transcriptional regulator